MSKIESRIKPAAPAMANMMENTESTFCVMDVFGARRPVCRSQRSEINPRSRKIVVMTLPVMKRGLIPKAPTSEIYAMC